MSAGAFRSVTVGVSSITDSLRLFRDVFGLRVDSDAEASLGLVEAWGLPPGSRLRLAELSCGGYRTGRLRLAELDPPATRKVRADLSGEPDAPTAVGPKAIDFYTEDIHAAFAQLSAAGYPPRSEPIHYTVGAIITTELLFTGPDGMPFLVMAGPHPPESKRVGEPRCAYSEVPTVSVICGDIDASRRFYGDYLGLTVGTDAEVAGELRDVVAALTGVPPGTRTHMRVFHEEGEPSGKYLLVHFFEASTTRLTGRQRPGLLGICLYTHEVAEVESYALRAPSFGAEVVAGPLTVDHVDGRRRLLLVRGPNEELLELVAAV